MTATTIVDPINPRPPLVEVRAARERLRGVAVHTPLLRLHEHARVWLKPEVLQPTGSFKIRGIWNALTQLTDAERERGVSIVSSGNAAQALAWSARRLGIRARAIMPASAPDAKVSSFRALGGQPEFRDPAIVWDMLLDRSYLDEPDAFIHPTANRHVVAGYGAIALEILEDLPDVAVVYVPLGGGGLFSGIANVFAELAPHVRMVGVQPSSCTPIIQGVEAGGPITTACDTICDGVAGTFMDPDTWPLLRDLLHEWATVDDADTQTMMRRLIVGNKLITEPSGALAVAAAMADAGNGPVVAIVSGGSVDAAKIVL